MSNRETLHRLIDTLPDASLETIERVLRNHQAWPPQPPADLEKLKERLTERFEKSQRQEAERTGRGVIAGFVGGSSSTTDGDGSASMTGWEGEALVKVEMRVFKRHKSNLRNVFAFRTTSKLSNIRKRSKGRRGKSIPTKSKSMSFKVLKGHLMSGYPVIKPNSDSHTSSRD